MLRPSNSIIKFSRFISGPYEIDTNETVVESFLPITNFFVAI